MTGIAIAVDACLEIDGLIRIKPFESQKVESLSYLKLWHYIRTNKEQLTTFGTDTWYSEGNKLAITFTDVHPYYKYELKALTLGMYTHGSSQGKEPLSWSTVRNNIISLIRLAKWLTRYGISSFSELNEISSLRIRNVIVEFVHHNNLQKHASYATSIITAINWLKLYGIVVSEEFFEVTDEIFSPYTIIKKQRRNKHSVIPVRILKKILQDCESTIEDTEAILDRWIFIQDKINDSIRHIPGVNYRRSINVDTLIDSESYENDQYNKIIKKLRAHTFVLVLAYTGMRYSEAIELSDNSAIRRDGKYYIKSLLSKTADGTQSLEWITNEVTFRAVNLLSKVCFIYRERARILLKSHGNELAQSRYFNLKFGLQEKKLFNVNLHRKSCQFSQNVKVSKNSFVNITKLFPVEVTKQDINELERMGCNYQSVGAAHAFFKKPYIEGDTFNLTAHMFRHTFAWFIVANRLGDLDDIKYQYKHLDNMMTLVYSQRGYESMDELVALTEGFSEFINKQIINEMVVAAQDGALGGKGGQNFIKKLSDILAEDITTGTTPHFKNMEELIAFAAKHTRNFRGVSHGYCIKGNECKVRNAADPSHCVACDGYIATPRHLAHWLVVKERCESQLASFNQLPAELRKRFSSFSTALIDNLESAKIIINQLSIKVKEA